MSDALAPDLTRQDTTTHQEHHTMSETQHLTVPGDTTPVTATAPIAPDRVPQIDGHREYIVLTTEEPYEIVGSFTAASPQDARVAAVMAGSYTTDQLDAGVPLRAFAASDWDRALRPVVRKVTEEYV